MKENEVKLLLVMVFAITAATLIARTSKELALLIIIANLLAYILVVLCRVLEVLKRKESKNEQ